jgi:ubiquitin-protein ligase E3 C
MLVELVKNVLSDPQPPQTYHPQTVCQVVANLLTIPLLPYRLPLKSLGSFSASMPFSDLNVISPHLVTPIVESLDESSRIHLLSNLVSFVPPRYPSLSKEAVSAYLQLLTALLNSLPILGDVGHRFAWHVRGHP